MASAKKSWKLLPSYSWKDDVLRHAKLVQQIKDIYRVKYEQQLMFPYEVRAILGDFFTLPGKKPDGSRGNDIMDLSPAVKCAKQAAIAILFTKMEEVLETLPQGSLEADEFEVICAWMDRCKLWKTKDTTASKLYDEIITKRTRETRLVKGHMSTIEKIVQLDEAGEKGHQPLLIDDMKEATEKIDPQPRLLQEVEERRKRQIENSLFRNVPKSATFSKTPKAQPANPDGEQFDPVMQTLDRLKKTDADLDRMVETIEKENESISHYVDGLLTYSKILLVMYLISVVIAGMSGDGFAIMINFVPCVTLGSLGIVMALFTPKIAMMPSVVLSIIFAVVLYPLYVVLRWTIYDTDPTAPLNRAVLWIIVAIEVVMFILAMYMNSLVSLRQRIFIRKGAILRPQERHVET